MTDSIAQMLTIIRNAQAVEHKTVKVPYSKVKFNLAQLLQKEGLIEKVEKKGNDKKPVIIITLKYYEDNSPRITTLKRVSKPGARIYVGYQDLQSVKQGHGIGIISTPKGLVTDREAKKQKVGGEYLAEIW